MNRPVLTLLSFALCTSLLAAATSETPAGPPPVAGPTKIMKISEIKPGMQGTAWTVFTGTKAEPVPVEILGLWKNAWGPKQDIILAKMGGKAQRTNVAGGMSGSPVYVDGKLIGAVALRISVFSPDAICGITPIELMLEINDFDATRPMDSKAPGHVRAGNGLPVPDGLLPGGTAVSSSALMVPIETPLTFSGFEANTMQQFNPVFQQLGVTAVQGGASGDLQGSKPQPGWQQSLNPGEAVAGVLVSGDKSVTGLGTVTYNDGKRVLAFGHPFFNLGPVNMPMSKGEVVMVLASAFQPNKFANATEIVGALKQDRHSGIMGELGAQAEMVPVSVRVRSYADSGKITKEKDLHFNVFVQQKWTPYLMMMTLYDSISGMNDFAEEATYRLSGKVEMDGEPNINLLTMATPNEAPLPVSMQLSTWWGDKFNRLFLNNVATPKLKKVDVSVDLLPERRIASIENAFLVANEVEAGTEVPVKVYLRPYRGDRIEKTFNVKIPAGLPKGEHRILLSDADTLNRMQAAAGAANRFIDLPETVSLINQERSNNKLYVSLVQQRPTVYYDDKTLPSLPASALNVMQSGRTVSRPLVSAAETAVEEMSLPFDFVVSGSTSLKVTVN